MSRKKIDLIGQRFNRLVVIEEVGRNKQGFVMWHCKCDCGNEVDVSGSKLRNGNTKSCGCLTHDILVKRNTKHNMVGTRFYEIYACILKRCNNKNSKTYYYYGARGIKCLWSSFEEFRDDMYESYLDHVKESGEKQTTLDCIDSNGNYSKENCRWATWKEQANNRGNGRYVTVGGECMTVAQASDRYGIKYTTIIGRLKNGKDIFGNPT